jgi:hypothetical protein
LDANLVPDSLTAILAQIDPALYDQIVARVESAKGDMTPVFESYKIGTSSAITSTLLEGSLMGLELPTLGRSRSFHDTEPGRNQKITTIQKLYYKVLERLIGNQEVLLTSANLLTVLNNDAFHRALIACCVETVFFIHNINCVEFR